jgi:hypothetical protein
MDLNIVIARYNESLEWLDKLPYDIRKCVRVYNKGDPIQIPDVEVVAMPNVGREAHTYLTHIIDNYNCLTNNLIFIQANPFEHVHRPPIGDLTQWVNEWCREEITQNYENEGNPYTFRVKAYNGENLTQAPTCIGKWFETYINRKYPAPETMKWYFGACFGVCRERVHLRSKVYYQRLLDQVSMHKSPEVAHYLERSWYYIFSCRQEP